MSFVTRTLQIRCSFVEVIVKVFVVDVCVTPSTTHASLIVPSIPFAETVQTTFLLFLIDSSRVFVNVGKTIFFNVGSSAEPAHEHKSFSDENVLKEEASNELTDVPPAFFVVKALVVVPSSVVY